MPNVKIPVPEIPCRIRETSSKGKVVDSINMTREPAIKISAVETISKGTEIKRALVHVHSSSGI